MKHNFTKIDILKEATKLKLFLAIFLVTLISFLGFNMASSTKAATGTSRTVYYNGTNVGSFHNFTGADTSSTDTTTTVTYKIYATCTVLSSIQSAKNYPFTGSITSDGTTQSFSGSTGSMSPGTGAVDKLIYTYNQNITRTCADRKISGSSSLKINTSGNYSGSGTSTASWSSSITIPGRTNYTITYNGNGGTLPSGIMTRCSECHENHVAYGYQAAIGVNSSGTVLTPTRTGYTFNGWNTNSDGSGGDYSAGQTITGSNLGTSNLYAKWSPNDYTVTFNPNGGSFQNTTSTSTKTVTYDSSTNSSLTEAPTRAGYTFNGWYTSTSGGTQVWNSSGNAVSGTYWNGSGATWKYTGNLTVYARWTANSYNITLNSNGGYYNSSNINQTVTVSTASVKNNSIGKAIMTSHTFKGWYTASSGGTQVFDANGYATTSGGYWTGSSSTSNSVSSLSITSSYSDDGFSGTTNSSGVATIATGNNTIAGNWFDVQDVPIIYVNGSALIDGFAWELWDISDESLNIYPYTTGKYITADGKYSVYATLTNGSNSFQIYVSSAVNRTWVGTSNLTLYAQWNYTPTFTVTRSDYNTFTYSATGASSYYVGTSSTAPAASASGWTTSTSKDISSAGTYYVWAKDSQGNVSTNYSTITAYTVSRSQGCGTTLTTRYDSTSSSTGTAFTSSTVMLSGTSVWASATINSGYSGTATLKHGSTTMTASGASYNVGATETITSAGATYNATPTITATGCNTFTVSATAGSSYHVSTSQTTTPAASATGWSTTTSYTASSAGTYYVWVKDSCGNVSANKATKVAYTISRSQGCGTTLTTRCNSTSSSTGTAFTSNQIVLAGVNVWAKSEIDSSHSGTATLKHGSTTMTASGAYFAASATETVTSAGATYTPTFTVTRSDYNTFTYSATNASSYYVSTSSTAPSASATGWTTSTSYDISSAGTYYVWAKDSCGYVSTNKGSIIAYTVSRSVGCGTTLTTRYDSTSSSTGTAFTASTVMLAGTSVWAKAEIDSSHSGTATLKHGSTTMTASGSSYTVGASETITSGGATYTPTFTVTRSDYNTFTYSATNASSYYVGTSSTAPSASASGWTTDTSKDISTAGTYYVWAKDSCGYVSTNKGSITAYTVSRSQGCGTTLTTRYDSTSSSTGTAFTASTVMLSGTSVWASGTINSGYSGTATLKHGSTTMTASGASYNVGASETITSGGATYNATPSISVTGCNTFSVSATAGSSYHVSTSQTTAPAASASGWSTTTSYTASSAGTYYVWVKDSCGNVSANKATKEAYTISRSQGCGTTLTTRCNSTSSSTGTAFTSNQVVLAGLNVWASASANTNYNNLSLKHGSTAMTTSGAYFAASTSETVASAATYTPTFTITRSDYNTFTYSATGASSYYVST